MRWGRVVLAGIGVPVVLLLLATLLTTIYAFRLALEAQGAPDQARIGQFAGSLGGSYGWIMQILLTVPAAAWAVRKVSRSRQLHGVLVGVVVAGFGLLMGFTLSPRAVVEVTLTVGAGWLGAALFRRRPRSLSRRSAAS
jgi:hypothetical protein